MSRLGHSILSVGTAASLALATLIVPAVSQEIAPSTFTTENVSPRSPFGTLPIDRSRIPDHLQDIATFLVRLSEAQRTELQQRCVVITGNADLYDDNSVDLCNAVLAAAGDAA